MFLTTAARAKKWKSSYPLLTPGLVVRYLYLLTTVSALVACGGSSNSSKSFTIGGTITGLSISSVVLANGTATVTVSAGASSWVFPSALASGSTYSVYVDTQPTGEVCGVTSGASGTLKADVDDITVVCSAALWTWEGGLNGANAIGVYGTQGTASAGDLPGAREGASSWVDSSGNLWLFGGYGYDSSGENGALNDLWLYSPSNAEWTWVSGGTGDNAVGVYATQGSASTSNLPGARQGASSWIDSSGNLWLFGGYGYDSTGKNGDLDDLWEYSPSTAEWTWVSGGSGDNTSGVYDTQGTASGSNQPGARYDSNCWTDSSGNLWLFGGYGYDSTGAVGNLNDLWRYSPSTGLWTWVSGAQVRNASGVYGTQNASSASNVPGARQGASSWIDSAGNLWLFGGYGSDSMGAVGDLNDLWQYSPSTREWTWVSGGDGDNDNGAYGTQDATSASNLPGARQGASSWIDSSGNLWLFGGYGYDATGGIGDLDDLWQYSPSTGEWTWINGGSVDNASGVYGTLGTGAASNVPGGRQGASAWVDTSGDLWLFGGVGYGPTGNGYLNDLWHFVVP